jgi:hypothetical protein
MDGRGSLSVAVVTSLAAFACSSAPHDIQLQPEAAPEARRVATIATSYEIAEECNKNAEESTLDGRTSRHIVETAYGEAVQSCGLISTELGSERFVEDFVRTTCGGQDSETCSTTYLEMFYARLRERYSFADWDWMVNHCKGYPSECSVLRTVELWALDLHNRAVDRWASVEMERANARAYALEAERRRAEAAAVKNVVDAFLAAARRPTLHCTTMSTGGGFSTTDCR